MQFTDKILKSENFDDLIENLGINEVIEINNYELQSISNEGEKILLSLDDFTEYSMIIYNDSSFAFTRYYFRGTWRDRSRSTFQEFKKLNEKSQKIITQAILERRNLSTGIIRFYENQKINECLRIKELNISSKLGYTPQIFSSSEDEP